MTDWDQVAEKLDKLLRFAAWNLHRSTQIEQEDAYQELCEALWKAMQYHNRQRRIETQLALAPQCDLHDKWRDRTKHGPYKCKFGKPEEQRLTEIVGEVELPPFVVDTQFLNYAKAIVWNRVCALAKAKKRQPKTCSLDDITKEISWI